MTRPPLTPEQFTARLGHTRRRPHRDGLPRGVRRGPGVDSEAAVTERERTIVMQLRDQFHFLASWRDNAPIRMNGHPTTIAEALFVEATAAAVLANSILYPTRRISRTARAAA